VTTGTNQLLYNVLITKHEHVVWRTQVISNLLASANEMKT